MIHSSTTMHSVTSLDNITIRADAALAVNKGSIFVHLHICVNAIIHNCYANRHSGKEDEINLVVTKIDKERSIAVGLIRF